MWGSQGVLRGEAVMEVVVVGEMDQVALEREGAEGKVQVKGEWQVEVDVVGKLVEIRAMVVVGKGEWMELG